ncbi:hypothetical protein [Spirobacillus cienkowskii]|uniref:hypothetical protein n=1 Tax=Spirobacillus cienkowskii TaxID=495820 RepID=UPI0030D2D74E
MSLSFAEYSIEQNLLSTDQVVEAMLIQLKSQPSNTELIYDLRVLSNDDFLKVLLNQQNENSDFIEEKILEISVFMIKFIQKNINKNSKKDIKKIKNTIHMAIIIINNYCISLKNSQNELDINEESKNLLKQLMNNLTKRNNYL